MIVVGDSGEALLLRSILENFLIDVRICFIGTPHEFLFTLKNVADEIDFVIISAHGDDHGFIFGEYASGIDTSMLVEGSLPASAFFTLTNGLSGKGIISTACLTGSVPFADVFKAAGAKYYIAPDFEPDGQSMPVYMMMLFHFLLVQKERIENAHKIGLEAIKEPDLMKGYFFI